MTTSNQAKIILSNPCSEDWNTMTTDNVGRYCQSCQKSVIDFTSKSDHEISNFLKDKVGQRLCGRFFTHQVDRIRIELDKKLLVSDIPFWQKFLVIVLVVFGGELFGYDFVFAQTADTSAVKVEQIDSVVTDAPGVQDSIIQTEEIKIEFHIPLQEKIILTQNPPILITYGNFWAEEDPTICYPEKEIGLIEEEPSNDEAFYIEKDDPDAQLPKTGMVLAIETEPKRPVPPVKAPRPQENAVIADSTQRRKTRRS